MNNVYYMKMMNGEDIVCQLVKEDEKHQMYLITNPLKVNYTFSPETGRMLMGLSRWIPLVEQNVITVYFDHVIAMAQLEEEMNEFYLSSVESAEDGILDDEEEETPFVMSNRTYSANTQLH